MTASEKPNRVQVTKRILLQCLDHAAVVLLESPFTLGLIDHLVYSFVPIENVFVYKKLLLALSRLLDYYPHLTGRLQFNPASHSAEISQLGAGAELLVAQCDVQLEDITSPDRASGRILISNLPDCGNALTPVFDPTLEGVCRDPIFTIQHTRFACGGIALGIRLHHLVCDASGFFQLARDLATIYRGLSDSERPSLSCPPEIHSYLREPLPMSHDERQEALRFQSSMFYTEEEHTPSSTDSNVGTKPPAERQITGPVTGRVLRFSGRDLAALKELATGPSRQSWISTFEALSAYLYQKVYRARIQLLKSHGLSESTAASTLSRRFWGSMDLRGPTRLNFSERYFPNAVSPILLPSTPHSLLAEKPLYQVASTLHNLIRSIDPQQITQEMKWVAAQPDKSRIKINYTFAGGNFTVSQWAKHDMYRGVNFDVDGCGKPISPVLVSPPFTEISRVDGLAMMLSTEERGLPDSGFSRSIDVNLTLVEPLWAVLDEEERFRGYCC